MSFLLLQSFPFISFGSDGNVYYCSMENSIGFHVKKDYKPTKFKPRRFKVFINFNKKTIKSESIFFGTSNDVCKSDEDNLICSNFWGGNFSINNNTLKFHYSVNFISINQSDDIWISHGKCEKF